MPTRRKASADIDAAIERRLSLLRQIPARAEAEALIARKFAEAGRPLAVHPSDAWTAGNLDGPLRHEDAIEPYPRAVRLAFWRGAIIAAALVALIIALTQ